MPFTSYPAVCVVTLPSGAFYPPNLLPGHAYDYMAYYLIDIYSYTITWTFANPVSLTLPSMGRTVDTAILATVRTIVRE